MVGWQVANDVGELAPIGFRVRLTVALKGALIAVTPPLFAPSETWSAMTTPAPFQAPCTGIDAVPLTLDVDTLGINCGN